MCPVNLSICFHPAIYKLGPKRAPSGTGATGILFQTLSDKMSQMFLPLTSLALFGCFVEFWTRLTSPIFTMLLVSFFGFQKNAFSKRLQVVQGRLSYLSKDTPEGSSLWLYGIFVALKDWFVCWRESFAPPKTIIMERLHVRTRVKWRCKTESSSVQVLTPTWYVYVYVYLYMFRFYVYVYLCIYIYVPVLTPSKPAPTKIPFF